MKQTLYLLAFCVFTILSFNSCSKDDDGGDNPPTNETTKKLDRAYVVDTESNIENEYRFQYNEDNTIKSIVKISNQISFTMQFEYAANTITANASPSQGEDFEVVMTFDNNILNNFSVNNQDIPVSFDADTNSYEILGGELAIDEDGDALSFSSNFSIDYDTTHKGAFYDVPSSNQQLLFLLLDESYLTTILTTKPVNSIDAGVGGFDFSNTYDDQGYIETAVDESVSFEYQYE